jgi:polyhydroxyalkanoate synthesis regulator phasin
MRNEYREVQTKLSRAAKKCAYGRRSRLTATPKAALQDRVEKLDECATQRDASNEMLGSEDRQLETRIEELDTEAESDAEKLEALKKRVDALENEFFES